MIEGQVDLYGHEWAARRKPEKTHECCIDGEVESVVAGVVELFCIGQASKIGVAQPRAKGAPRVAMLLKIRLSRFAEGQPYNGLAGVKADVDAARELDSVSL